MENLKKKIKKRNWKKNIFFNLVIGRIQRKKKNNEKGRLFNFEMHFLYMINKLNELINIILFYFRM